MSNNNLQPSWLVDIIKDSLSKLSPTNMFLGSVFLIVLGLTPAQKLFDKEQTDTAPHSKIYTQHNGRADYARLKLGMDLVEVESILGRGNEIEQSETTSTFIWENVDNSSITVVFGDEKLKSKSQVELK